MASLRLMSLVLCALVLSGCGSAIFHARFDSGAGSPQGAPPGSPTDDQIRVNSTANPVVSAGKLVFSPTGGHSAFFFSRPVQNSDSRKTVFWIGRLTSGSGPFVFQLSAENAPGTPFATNPLTLSFANKQVKVTDLNDAQLHSAPLVANGEHRVFVSLRLQPGSEHYRITIGQATAPEIEFTGTLPALTATWIKTHSRILLKAGFLPATGSDQYVIDEIIMRELQ
jgi:hypothetical protein